LQTAGARSDNVTVLALEWESPEEAGDSSGFTETDMLQDGDFASTVQTESVDLPTDDIDEETIERSIAEINAALQRPATRRG
jgi:hypothetical protein